MTYQLPQNFDSDFDRLIASFESIAQAKSTLRRRFELCKDASYRGIPKAEFRKLFELRLVESLSGGHES